MLMVVIRPNGCKHSVVASVVQAVPSPSQTMSNHTFIYIKNYLEFKSAYTSNFEHMRNYCIYKLQAQNYLQFS